MDTHIQINYDSTHNSYSASLVNSTVQFGQLKLTLGGDDPGHDVPIIAQLLDDQQTVQTTDQASLPSGQSLFLVADDDTASAKLKVDGHNLSVDLSTLDFTYRTLSFDGSNYTAPINPTATHRYLLVGQSNTIEVDASGSAPSLTFTLADGTTSTQNPTNGSSPYAYDVPAHSVSVEGIELYYISGSTTTLFLKVDSVNGESVNTPYAVPPVLTPLANAVEVQVDPDLTSLWFYGTGGTPRYTMSTSIPLDDSSSTPWNLHFKVAGDDPKVLIKRPVIKS